VNEAIFPAFVGALFAFAFMWLWDFIVRFNQRWDRHHSGVVKLARATNEQLGALTHAIYEIDQIVDAYNNAMAEPGVIPMSANQPDVIPVDSSFEYDIVNLDLVNDFADLRYSIQTANRDIRRLGGLKANLQSAFSGGQLKPQDYLSIVNDLSIWLQDLRAGLIEIRNEATVLTAKARVRADRDAPRFHKFSMRARTTRYEKDFSEALAIEKTKLIGEIATNVQKSHERHLEIATKVSRGDV
jgi:hypothetical protein